MLNLVKQLAGLEPGSFRSTFNHLAIIEMISLCSQTVARYEAQMHNFSFYNMTLTVKPTCMLAKCCRVCAYERTHLSEMFSEPITKCYTAKHGVSVNSHQLRVPLCPAIGVVGRPELPGIIQVSSPEVTQNNLHINQRQQGTVTVNTNHKTPSSDKASILLLWKQ